MAQKGSQLITESLKRATGTVTWEARPCDGVGDCDLRFPPVATPRALRMPPWSGARGLDRAGSGGDETRRHPSSRPPKPVLDPRSGAFSAANAARAGVGSAKMGRGRESGVRLRTGETIRAGARSSVPSGRRWARVHLAPASPRGFADQTAPAPPSSLPAEGQPAAPRLTGSRAGCPVWPPGRTRGIRNWHCLKFMKI